MIAIAIIYTLSLNSASAAKFYYESNQSFVRGCTGMVNIMIDTEGKDVLSADAMMNFTRSEVTVDSTNIGTALPLEAYNRIDGTDFYLSGAKFGGSGVHQGIGLFGKVNLTLGNSTNNFTLNFSQDFTRGNVIAEAATFANLITSAESKTFPVLERYNMEVDGIGFCNPDLTAPTVTFITPRNGSGGNPVDTNIIFSLKDNRAGVDISTLDVTVKVGNNTKTFSQDTENSGGTYGIYRVTLDPENDFEESDRVDIEVKICDLNTTPGANCRTQKGVFRIYTPPPPAPVCGDGIPTYSVGEQCDDGEHCADGTECTENSDCAGVSGDDQTCAPRMLEGTDDTCNALCLWEIPEIECPVCEEGDTEDDPPSCPTTVCGNGILETGEQCDDGNTVNSDGCSSVCAREVSDNGHGNDPEKCDPSNPGENKDCQKEELRSAAPEKSSSCLEKYMTEDVVKALLEHQTLQRSSQKEVSDLLNIIDILLKKENVSEQKKQQIEAKLISLKNAVDQGEEGQSPFIDVPVSHPDYSAIYNLYDRYVIEGYADGTYKPEKNISREEFIKIVLGTTDCRDCTNPNELEKKLYFEKISFPDVNEKRWSHFCVAKAKKNRNYLWISRRKFPPRE